MTAKAKKKVKKKAKPFGPEIFCSYTKLERLDKLKPNPANPNKHPDSQVDLLIRLITTHGWRHPITVSNRSGFVVAGHCRLLAAAKMGLKQVPVDEQDFASAAEELAVLVADNQIPELAEIEGLKMADILCELDQANYPLELTALSAEEIRDYIDGPTGPTPQDDIVPEPPKIPETKTGDLYRLGEHRLLCGDSTKAEDVERPMDGQKADMVFTDPPYGMNLDTDYSKMPISPTGAKPIKHKNIIGDDRDYNPTHIFEYFGYCKEILLFGADYYCKYLPQSSWFVWDKRVTENFDKMIGSAFELIWSKNKHKREIARFNNTLYSGESDAINKLHPTQKPIKLIEWFLNKFGGDNIVDLFLGSGSTLIAAEKLGRRCFGMEIDPLYCDVIVKRWEEFTGKKANKQ